MDEKLQQTLAEQLARKPPAMDTVREFLQYQVWGAEPEDVERSITGLHAVNPTASARSSRPWSRSSQPITRRARSGSSS